jgi:hypothetical protein
MRKNVFMVLDTETADATGNVYDIGYVICDRHGNTFTEYNAAVREVFTNPARMMGAYYAKKTFSHYVPMFDAGTLRLVPWLDIVGQIRADIAKHNVTAVTAYNATFDFRALRNTHGQLGHASRILPAGLRTLDLWLFACETIFRQRTYHKLADRLGWLTDAGNVRTTAEHAFRYVSGEFDFCEDHTALSDARIERDILVRLLAQRKRIPWGKLIGSPWRIAQDAR